MAPIEIIDGQHRLLAFEGTQHLDGNFELPVVAFFDLDITWQAYLFYMINIKPKRIDPSLAFDLYPVLRIQDWLEKMPETAKIYVRLVLRNSRRYYGHIPRVLGEIE
ncbi:MAG: hypothetical protein H6647_20855 [Anaerolineales bacterium]|nr:hypothetical protein [Anaerolineales bacterium]